MKATEELLSVRIISPTQVFFDGSAVSVSSKNYAGNFDVLAEHANFITVIENTPIIVRPTNGKELRFEFPLAIIFVSNNVVKVFTYIQPKIQDTLKQ
ncbi:hypothetical protein HYW42_03210 [Candidatus Daviesbacteria bacterium]|nr:hypothetical protein [Candidatus Daviesbacteria bacterium]